MRGVLKELFFLLKVKIACGQGAEDRVWSLMATADGPIPFEPRKYEALNEIGVLTNRVMYCVGYAVSDMLLHINESMLARGATRSFWYLGPALYTALKNEAEKCGPHYWKVLSQWYAPVRTEAMQEIVGPWDALALTW